MWNKCLRLNFKYFSFGQAYMRHVAVAFICLTTFNYVFRDVKAPVSYASTIGFPPVAVSDGLTSNVNTIVNTVEDRILFQLTWML